MILEEKKARVLFILLVWPEPTSSAAGYRILQLMTIFEKANFEIHVACAAQKTNRSAPLHYKEHHIELNDDSFDPFVAKLNPDVVVYDRFIAEEQYGWRVRKMLPQTLTILDTEDLHFVRKAREIAIKNNSEPDFYSEEAKRELASIWRSDLSIIISTYEMQLLQEMGLPAEKIYYLPFLHESNQNALAINDFDSRKNIMFIGNYLHQPNVHAVKQIKNEIWPIIHRQLPKVEMHIYGAYTQQAIKNLHEPKKNFFVMGEVDNVFDTMNQYRVLLAPLWFGAGIKGKFFDAMISGLPSITTPIGVEGMLYDSWNGYVESDYAMMANKTIELYQNKVCWEKAQSAGLTNLSLYESSKWENDFQNSVVSLAKNVHIHRKKYFFGEILFHQNHLAVKYLSLYIAQKNR